MNLKEVEAIAPSPYGWLEYKLNNQEMDYVWRCIKNKKEKSNQYLAGNITASYALMDRGDWFGMNVVLPLCNVYAEKFEDLGDKVPTTMNHPYYMDTWWVNYQKQNEFNPVHNHGGVYSFVIWMKIPYDSRKQNQKDIARNSTAPLIGDFQFLFSDTLGKHRDHTYRLSPHYEGTMLFFPAELNHLVYPFFDCDEDRISVSGNIRIDTSRRR